MSEWAWLVALAALLVTIAINLIATGRWVGSVKGYVDQEVAAERLARTTSMVSSKDEHAKALSAAVKDRDDEMERLRREWSDSQRTQDNSFGEVGLSLRRAIDDLKDDIHEREMWGRDNYVQKGEIDSMRDDIKGLRSDIRDLIAEIKRDFKDSIKELKGGAATPRT